MKQRSINSFFGKPAGTSLPTSVEAKDTPVAEAIPATAQTASPQGDKENHTSAKRSTSADKALPAEATGNGKKLKRLKRTGSAAGGSSKQVDDTPEGLADDVEDNDASPGGGADEKQEPTNLPPPTKATGSKSANFFSPKPAAPKPVTAPAANDTDVGADAADGKGTSTPAAPPTATTSAKPAAASKPKANAGKKATAKATTTAPRNGGKGKTAAAKAGPPSVVAAVPTIEPAPASVLDPAPGPAVDPAASPMRKRQRSDPADASPRASPRASPAPAESDSNSSSGSGNEASPGVSAPPKRRRARAAKAKAGDPPPEAAVADLASDLEDAVENSGSSSEPGEGSSEGSEQAVAAAEGGEEAVSAPKKKKAAVAKKARAPKAKAAAAAKVEGVGTGSIELAARHASCDTSSLVTWPAGAPAPYGFLADAFERIAGTSKRLAIVYELTCVFRALLAGAAEDLLPAVYLCVNRVAPQHEGKELGLGEATLIKALAQATGRTEAAVKREYESSGDLGTVAASCRATQRTMFQPAALTVRGVFKTFKEIAALSGSASQEKKRALITKLLVASKGAHEPGYIIRSLQSKLRIGLAEQSVLVALAHAVALHADPPPSRKLPYDWSPLAARLEQAAQAVKDVYSECPSYDMMVPALLAHPLSELATHVHFTPGVPVRPMLAKATTGVGEVLDKFTDSEFTCEYKYDGERAQVHVTEDGSVHIYSRNAEDHTGKYPDLVGRVKGHLQPHVRSIVIDAEAVAWDAEAKRILPFQILSTRSRKDVKEEDVKVAVCLYAFDCLYLNGEPLLRAPLTQRREALYGALSEEEGRLHFATAKVSRDVEELEAFLNEAVDASTEGLIVKTLGDTYEPSKRSSHWLKLKKDYLEGVGDTFDVVPIGGFYGKGKRAGVFGAYLLAVYEPEEETYQTISKLGTGFSEELLKELADSLRPHVIPVAKSYYRYGETQLPDVWFDTAVVWEVKAADLSISPVHRAAAGRADPQRGISIRFPRLLRVRSDKSPEDATTAEQVAEMYSRQAVVKAEKARRGELDKDAEED